MPTTQKSAVKAVLFDLDGTLIDSLRDIADAMNRALARLGYPAHAQDAYRYHVGDGVETLARRALPAEQRSPGQIARAKDLMQREYRQAWAVRTRPFPGVPDLLTGLGRRGMAVSVLSNKPQELTERIVKHFFSAWPISPVYGAQPGRPLKPDPAAALEIGKLLHIPPEQIALVGDTATDMETAAAAGMIPVGALWGFRPEELRANKTILLLEQPPDLLRLC